MSPLLITTALEPPENSYALKMVNRGKREILTKAGVYLWAGYGIKKIVLADSTGKTLLSEEDTKNLLGMGVEVEQISYFQDNQTVLQKGKGFGEGALIDFSLHNSNILSAADCFYKCTGKIFCRNFGDIESIVQQNGIQNIYWRDPLNQWIDTRFFHTSKSFCKNFLVPAYQKIEDRKGLWAEHVVHKLVTEKFTEGRSLRPLLSGFSGSQDKPYFDAALGFLDLKFPCWIGSRE